ncbi:zinc ABC transporter substrate-binding protein, partial [Halapricum sp. CBA1109]|nr:zinc ABC transporter substrate-binding protein [Halapricum sp. CBA1109]
MEHTRRGLLTATAGIASVSALAGCLGGLAGDSADGSTVQATFFVFGDIAAEVAGAAASTNLLVPVGQHGHGWEPGPRV